MLTISSLPQGKKKSFTLPRVPVKLRLTMAKEYNKNACVQETTQLIPVQFFFKIGTFSKFVYLKKQTINKPVKKYKLPCLGFSSLFVK